MISLTALVAMLAFPCVQPAQAQYFGYSPYSGLSNLSWIARGFGYPLYRNSGYNAPFYLANSLVWNATYAASRGLGFNRQPGYGQVPNTQLPTGQLPNGQSLPVSGYRTGQMVSGPVVDQSVPAKWTPQPRPWPQDQQTDPSWVPLAQNGGAPSVPEVIPEDPFAPAGAGSAQPGGPAIATAPQQYTMGSPLNNSGAPPAVAPGPFSTPQLMPQQPPVPEANSPVSKKKGSSWFAKNKQKNTSAGLNGAAASSESPLTKGFLHLVNENYGGNIGYALSDPDMRRYAQAIGLISSNQPVAEITAERSELIKQILSDSTQDPSVRVNAARILLKPKTQAAGTGISQ